MASSLNGLTVGDSMAEHLMDSPVRSESICYQRDEVSSQYSPMSEDSDDIRYADNPMSSSPHLEIAATAANTSSISPHRQQRMQIGAPTTVFAPLPSCSLAAVAVSSNHRQRGSENESRFPSSPNDVCHTGDLRRTALMRSVQIRAQGEEKPWLCWKEDGGYQSPEREVEDYIEDCSSVDGLSDTKFGED